MKMKFSLEHIIKCQEKLKNFRFGSDYPLLAFLDYWIPIVQFIPSEDLEWSMDQDLKLLYNPQMVIYGNKDKLAFCLAHELLHLIFLHVFIKEARYSEILETCADVLINTFIKNTSNLQIFSSLVAKDNKFNLCGQTIDVKEKSLYSLYHEVVTAYKKSKDNEIKIDMKSLENYLKILLSYPDVKEKTQTIG